MPGSPAPSRRSAIGTWTAWTGTAFVVGPLLGGVLVDALSWRWIFGVNIVPLAVTLYLTTRLSRDEFRSERRAEIDVVGAVLNAVGLTGAVYALIEQQRLGLSHPGGADQPAGRRRLPDRVSVVGAQGAEPDDAAAHLRRAQFRRRQPRHRVPVRRGVAGDSARGAVPAGDGGHVGHRGRHRHPADTGVVVLPGAPVRHPGGQARPAALHGARPADRRGRLSVDDNASTIRSTSGRRCCPDWWCSGSGCR